MPSLLTGVNIAQDHRRGLAMEQILPALEGRLRCFRRHAGWLSKAHPRLAGQLAPSAGASDAHVDRLVQGVAMLHARSALALRRALCQQDEHLLELHFPGQLRPFPECRIGPPSGASGPPGAEIVGARYCAGPEAAVELDLELRAPPEPCLGGPAACIEVYIDGETAFSAALRSALLAGGEDGGAGRSAPPGPRATIRRSGQPEPSSLPRWPFAPTGLDPAEALLPRPPGAHAGLPLLREFFTFPARFNVLRLELPPWAAPGRWTLTLPVPRSDDRTVRLLQALQASHLRAGWSASACLQRAAAAPVPVDGRQSEFPLSVPPALEIFSIDRVRIDGAPYPGWIARQVAGAPPGHEWRIAFACGDWQPCGTASIDITCCERKAVLARPARGPGARWQLNSLLALEQLPHSAATLREAMASQAISASPASQAIIGAIRGLDARAGALRVGRAAPMPGTELRLQVEEAAFAGCGLLLFAQVMDRFFGECAHLNTFTRLVLVSASTGEELMRCKARNAGIVLE
jgi:type VI protein secretion system component VasA